MNTNTATAQVIPFRKAELLLVEHAGEPFVPMKPVVEGMGLAWQVQHRKLMSSRFAATITEMVIVAGDGKQRAMTCLPLRKLTGWLMSISPNKVKPELRDGIIAYQNECDDVLWAYWNEGRAVRNDDRTIETVLNTTIGTDGFHCLSAVVEGKVRVLPTPVRRQAKAKLWAQVRAAFNVRRTQDIPADKLDAARNFVGAYALEGEWLPKDERKPGTFVLGESQAQDLSDLLHYTDWVNFRWRQGIGEAVKVMNPRFHSQTWEFFQEAKCAADRLERGLPELMSLFRGREGQSLRPHECIAKGRPVGNPAS